jgi:hypothetical protein
MRLCQRCCQAGDVMPLRARWREGPPACWRWKPPSGARIDRVRREYSAYARQAGQGFQWRLMCDWQNERCAVCGRRTQALRTDHDHETGLIRGFLCPSCNTSEGCSRGGGGIFAEYRERCPAMICGLVMVYQYHWSFSKDDEPGARS